MGRPPSTPAAPALSPAERDWIRRMLGVYFGTHPTVAEGVVLRARRTGPGAGEPKLPRAAASLAARGLLRVAAGRPGPPRAHFTEAGLAALRAMFADRRLADPAAFAHVRRELGLPTAAAPAGADRRKGWG